MPGPDLGALLADAVGIDRDLVAFVGAGGKTTLLLALGETLRRRGRQVLLTTTTKVGRDQVAGVPDVWFEREDGVHLVGPSPEAVGALWTATSWGAGAPPGLVLADRRDRDRRTAKSRPIGVEVRAAEGRWDAVLVEADGARHHLVKAPDAHEPVIPACTTVVVGVLAADALGRPIREVAHRPARLAHLVGCTADDPFTVECAARLADHPDGMRKAVPPAARFAVAVTRVGEAEQTAAVALGDLLGAGGVAAVLLPRVL